MFQSHRKTIDLSFHENNYSCAKKQDIDLAMMSQAGWMPKEFKPASF